MDVAAAGRHTCARRMDNTLWCWGSNQWGELATDTIPFAFKSTPIQVTGGTAAWAALGLGWAHTCAIDAAQHLWCAGNSGDGSLALPGSGSRRSPVQPN